MDAISPERCRERIHSDGRKRGHHFGKKTIHPVDTCSTARDAVVEILGAMMANPNAHLNGRGRVYTPEESALVERLRIEGWSLGRIAKLIGRHKQSVYKHLLALAKRDESEVK
jgi:hypothetical protein